MKAVPAPRDSVVRYLAVLRAARDFGLNSNVLDALTLRFPPGSGSIDKLAEALTAAALERRPAS